MIVNEFKLARRLSNLYWAGFNKNSGHYLLKWSQLRDLAGGVLDNDEMEEVVKFLLGFGFLLAQSDDGVIIWHKTEVNPREILERTLYQALQYVEQENESEIENALL